MQVKDPKKIRKLMVLEDVSARGLAKELGYASPTHFRRVLDGEIKTMTPDKAARLARRLGVGMDDLFVPRLSSDSGQNEKGHVA
jgi:plasmid maintenance system antidote protein VapI